jgi:hypothetical protein
MLAANALSAGVDLLFRERDEYPILHCIERVWPAVIGVEDSKFVTSLRQSCRVSKVPLVIL